MNPALLRLDAWLGELVSKLDGPVADRPRVRWRDERPPDRGRAPSASRDSELEGERA